jgi:hypothetical protein
MRYAPARLALAALAMACTLLGGPSRVLAQAAPDAMLECRQVHDDLARLKCYDHEIDRAQAGAAPAGSANARAAPLAPTVAALPAPAPRAAMPAPAAAAPAALENLTITSVQWRADKGFVARLDNGQAWEQAPGEQRVSVGVGQVVRIKRMVLGSYLMIGPHSLWTSRVRQVNQP